MKKLIITLTTLLTTISVFSQELYDINNVTTIELTFTDPNWDATMDTYYTNDMDERLLGTAVVNGVQFDSVGVKYKGNSTYNANNGKNPLNIKLNYILNQDYDGFQTLKLSNGDKDPSFVREVLSYEIARKYMDAPLSNYAEVYINGSYYGCFSSSESVNGDFQEKYLNADDNNTRVKCNPVSVMNGGSSLQYLGTDSASYYDYYEMASDFGWSDLINLTNTVDNNPANIETDMDIDRAIWMLAFNNVLVNLDSYTGPFRQNYYLIKDDNQRMVPVVWDMNECFGGFEMINSGGGGGGPTSTTDLIQLDPLLRMGDSDWPLLDLILSDARYQRMYIAHCRTMLEENFSNGWYHDRADSLQDIVYNSVANDPNAFFSINDFTSNVTTSTGQGPGGAVGIVELMDGRVTFLQGEPEYTATPPTIANINVVGATSPYSTVTLTADISNATYAHVGYRHSSTHIFTKVQLYDDGAHNDGGAGDGTWGVDLNINASDIQYYIYADNSNAGMFSPQRAEHEFYTISVASDVVLNEFMASNSTTEADQDGEYDDWVELYNNATSAVSLDGYYLTDDATDLTKWAFPTVSIGANDYLIVWADNDTAQTGLHANFKLSASGEALLLVDPQLNIVDEIVFGNQTTDWTTGRFANGTGPFISMPPTFNAENIAAVGVEEWMDNVQVNLFPNPAGSMVTINTDSFDPLPLQVFDMKGSVLVNATIRTQKQLNVTTWNPGLYLVRVANTTHKLVVE